MIKPTVGRVVWYHPGDDDPPPLFRGEALAAIVTRVHGDREVNLTVFRADGITYGRHNIRLRQEGDAPWPKPFCEWMPYQLGQAKKTEAAEAKLAETRG